MGIKTISFAQVSIVSNDLESVPARSEPHKQERTWSDLKLEVPVNWNSQNAVGFCLGGGGGGGGGITSHSGQCNQQALFKDEDEHFDYAGTW